MKPGVLLVRNAGEADELAGQVRASDTKLQIWITSFGGDGIGLLRALSSTRSASARWTATR